MIPGPTFVGRRAHSEWLVRNLGDWRGQGHAACRPRNILESQTRAAQAWYYFTPTTSFHSGGDSARMVASKDINGMDFSHQKQRRKQHICKGVYKHNDICTFFCSKNSDHFEVFPSNGACIRMVSEICSLTYMNRQPSHLEGWNHAEAARLWKKGPGIQPGTKTDKCHIILKISLLAWNTSNFPYIFPIESTGETTMTNTTQRLGWQPRAWFTPGWFTSGFCW